MSGLSVCSVKLSACVLQLALLTCWMSQCVELDSHLLYSVASYQLS